tara:strand:- start:430 stop:1479 length:1050 start_codon:yes stop_codon:yes gene_type:complete
LKKKKKIGLVFDSRYSIGGGHFWRCFNLANMINNNDKEFFFISNFLKPTFVKILKKKSYKYIKLKQIKNINSLSKTIQKYELNILITDCYEFNSNLKKKLKSKVDKLIVIDDYVNKKHHCDILINHNFMNTKTMEMIKKLNKKSYLFLGKNFFISNKKLFNQKKNKSNKLKKIFVFFGTSDETNETIKIVNLAKSFHQLKFNILIGRLNKNYKKIKNCCKNKKNIKIFYNLNNDEVIGLMRKNDFSIGSGGINLTERLFLNLPSIVISNAGNQIRAIKALKDKKLIYYLGSHKKVSMESIKKSLSKFTNNEKLFLELKKRVSFAYNGKTQYNLFSSQLNYILVKKNLTV